MPSQKLELALQGLYTAPNSLSGVPPGALTVADNVVINSANLIESRRGQTQYGDPLSIGSGQANKLFNYSSSLIVNYDDKMAYDFGDGNWIDYSGTYLPPDASIKMHSLEAQKNFYFTTSQGVFKIDSLTATPKEAGSPRALGGTAELDGTSGFLVADSAVAYRMLWGYRDANQNLILGAPSQRLVVRNGTADDVDVELTFIIPDAITTSFFYQIYRSVGTAAASDEPSDEMQLVIEGNPTSGEISARSFTIVDTTPYSLMRATLYTSPSQQGIANSNYQPPFCWDMDNFKNCTFYANTKQKQSLSIALLTAGAPNFGYYSDTGDTTDTSPIITNISDTTDIRVGMRVIGTGIPSDTLVLSIDSPTQVTLTNDATATASGVSLEFQDRITLSSVDYWGGSTQDLASLTFLVDTGGTPGENINNTAINLVEIVNLSVNDIYAYYLSSGDDLPGQILFEERAIGGAEFSATSTAGDSFSPSLPTSGTSVSSDNDSKPNRVYISKPGETEAVPLYRYFDIGSANFGIQRVVALRDGIFFFKADGIYRIAGETFESFTVTLLDNTAILKVPESAVAFNNQVFCFTTQGVCAVTDSFVKIMSVPIEDQLLELSSEQFTYFASASFGVAYESARLYMFFTVTTEDDTFATQAYVYNSLTNSWSRWIMNRTCGVVNTSVNKLFMAEADTGQILIERKTYTNNDYADEEYPVVIDTVVSDTEITLVDASLVKPGMTLKQGFRNAYIEDVQSNTLTITETLGLEAGSATVYTPIENKVQWTPIDCENPGVLKQFSELTFFFKNAAFREIEAGFSTNTSIGSQAFDIANVGSGGWGTFPWGQQEWGGQVGGASVLRTYVPREKQRASWLILYLKTKEAFTGFSLQGVSVIFNAMSTRIK